MSRAMREDLPRTRQLPDMRARLEISGHAEHALALAITPPLGADERGQRNQHRLRALANAGSGEERSVFFRTLYGEATDEFRLHFSLGVSF